MHFRLTSVGFLINVECKPSKNGNAEYVLLTMVQTKMGSTPPTWIKLFVHDKELQAIASTYSKGTLIYAEGTVAVGDPKYGTSILCNVSHLHRLSKSEIKSEPMDIQKDSSEEVNFNNLLEAVEENGAITDYPSNVNPETSNAETSKKFKGKNRSNKAKINL